jgi:hypothetical protein
MMSPNSRLARYHARGWKGNQMLRQALALGLLTVGIGLLWHAAYRIRGGDGDWPPNSQAWARRWRRWRRRLPF